jgi:hypothetical protein
MTERHTPSAGALLSQFLADRLDGGEVQIPAMVARQLRAAGLLSQGRYRWATWDDERNDLISIRGEELTVAQVCFAWLATISPEHKSDIWLVGPSGMGKDHLATVMAVALAIRYQWTARRCDWMVLTEELKPNNGASATLQPYKAADVLIVSDPDRPDQTLFKNKKLGELVRARKDKVTIWTANTPLKTFCQRIRTSCRRDERDGYNGVGTMLAVKMEEAAKTIESRLLGRVAGEVPFRSRYGDWRVEQYERRTDRST